MVIYITRDLMFSSRVRPIVAAQGKALKMASSIEDCLAKLPAWLAEWDARRVDTIPSPTLCVVVDLKAVADPTGLGSLLSALSERDEDEGIRTLAYGPHVHVELLAAAESAGFETVMTQGQFDRGFTAWLASGTA